MILAKQMILIKRIYNPAEKSDGFRILVDRLWPRGIKKEQADIDFWAKEIAPSVALRKWFNHEPEKFATFKHKYRIELEENPSLAEFLKQIAGHQKITLLFGAKDEEHNQAVVLQDFLQQLKK